MWDDNLFGNLTQAETVQKFTILPGELTVAGGELSPSMKVKRFYICKKYDEQVKLALVSQITELLVYMF